MRMASSREPSLIPRLLSLNESLDTALRLQGLSAIANTRLGQSGSSPQRDTVVKKSLQFVQDIGGADLSPSHSLAFITDARDALLVTWAGPWLYSRAVAGLE